MLQVTYQRQYNVLSLAFAHIQILLYRPFLLRDLASLGKETWISDLVRDASPTSYIADVTSWEDFDSLVLTGLGELFEAIFSPSPRTFLIQNPIAMNESRPSPSQH